MRTDIDYRVHRQVGFDYFYRFHCETNDCSPDIAVEKWIADDLGFDFEKRCVMALFHGATYAGPCESMFADKFPVLSSDVINDVILFFESNKSRLLFSPDCKYRKIYFKEFLLSVAESIKPYGTLGKYIQSCFYPDDKLPYDHHWLNHYGNYIVLQQRCFKDWTQWGRMAHWCFSEALHRFIDAPILPPTMEFGPQGDSHTRGWAFCVGWQNAEDFKITKENSKELEESAAIYLTQFKNINKGIPNANFFTLETACCNYKRQHKGSRYPGCYIDEQYDEIMQMKRDWKEYNWLWDKYLEGRVAVIPKSLLYEKNKYKTDTAYIKSWNKVLVDYGRMPRIESWFNHQPQLWVELDEMPFAKSSIDLTTLI